MSQIVHGALAVNILFLLKKNKDTTLYCFQHHLVLLSVSPCLCICPSLDCALSLNDFYYFSRSTLLVWKERSFWYSCFLYLANCSFVHFSQPVCFKIKTTMIQSTRRSHITVITKFWRSTFQVFCLIEVGLIVCFSANSRGNFSEAWVICRAKSEVHMWVHAPLVQPVRMTPNLNKESSCLKLTTSSPPLGWQCLWFQPVRRSTSSGSCRCSRWIISNAWI